MAAKSAARATTTAKDQGTRPSRTKASAKTPVKTSGAAAPAGSVPAPDADPAVTWLDAPEEHDYPAAASYLSLVADAATVERTVEALRRAPTATYLAKDILRASGLPLLPVENPHVRHDLKKIGRGTSLSPVLLVRGDARSGRPAQVADGYHRICASYHTDENTPVTVRIADLAAPDDGSR